MSMDETFTAVEQFYVQDEHFVMGFVAPHNSGKTFLLKRIIMERLQQRFHNIIVFSPTCKFKDEYKEVDDYFDGSGVNFKVITEAIPTMVRTVLREQKANVRQSNDDPDSQGNIHTLLIFDDCMDQSFLQWSGTDNEDSAGQEVGFRGRHFCCSMIYTVQTFRKISNIIRNNTDYMFVFSFINFVDAEKVLEEFVPREMRSTLRRLLVELFKTPYAFLLIDSTSDARHDWRKRLKRGFKELMFPEDMDEMEPKILIGGSRKRKRRS